MRRLIALVLALGCLAGLAGFVYDRLKPAGPSVSDVRRSLPRRLAQRELEQGEPVFIRIFKAESVLELWMQAHDDWRLFQTYPVCRWSGRLGPKLKRGDGQAPEGFYQVRLDQLNPNSRRHLAFNLGFPNAFDRAHGRTGSFLMVHGGCASAGCYAMTDGGIDDIYRLVEAALLGGQEAIAVHVFPFRMSDANMAKSEGHRWVGFWRNLKVGHDVFEDTRRIPMATVKDGRYEFGGSALTGAQI